MNRKTFLTVSAALLLAMPVASAKEKEANIASDTSGISHAQFVNNIALAAIGMGVKEPLNISMSQESGKKVLTVSGSNSTRCRIPVSDGNPPTMNGISCK